MVVARPSRRERAFAMLEKLRLLHTSDLHLGGHWHGDSGMETLRAVVDGVALLGADALLLVGDIFDHARVSDGLLESFLHEVGRATAPAILLPGNHDLYDGDSIYRRAPFREKPDNLHIFGRAEGQVLRFPALSLEAWGRAMSLHTPGFRPLEGMPGKTPGAWRVALAHGHVHLDGDTEVRSSPIFPAEIARAPCDYLALGHWDRHADVSQGGVKAVYSGSPWGPLGNNGTLQATVVDLDPRQGVTTRQTALGGEVYTKLRGSEETV